MGLAEEEGGESEGPSWRDDVLRSCGPTKESVLDRKYGDQGEENSRERLVWEPVTCKEKALPHGA